MAPNQCSNRHPDVHPGDRLRGDVVGIRGEGVHIASKISHNKWWPCSIQANTTVGDVKATLGVGFGGGCIIQVKSVLVEQIELSSYHLQRQKITSSLRLDLNLFEPWLLPLQTQHSHLICLTTVNNPIFVGLQRMQRSAGFNGQLEAHTNCTVQNWNLFPWV